MKSTKLTCISIVSNNQTDIISHTKSIDLLFTMADIGLTPSSTTAANVRWWMRNSFGKYPRPLQVEPCTSI
jgi:hypothetical protein